MNRWVVGSSVVMAATLLSLGFAPKLALFQAQGQIPNDLENLYGNLLEHAKTKANSDRLEQAVRDISGIPQNSRYSQLAQQFQEAWSKDLLQLANEKYRQADLESALSILKTVPPSSSVYNHAQELIVPWSEHAKQLNQVAEASTKRNWSQVLQALEPLKGTELYTSPRLQALLQTTIDNAFEPSDAARRVALTRNKNTNTSHLSAPAPTISPVAADPAPKFMALAVDVNDALQVSTSDPGHSTIASSEVPSSAQARTNPVPVLVRSPVLTATQPTENANTASSATTSPPKRPSTVGSTMPSQTQRSTETTPTELRAPVEAPQQILDRQPVSEQTPSEMPEQAPTEPTPSLKITPYSDSIATETPAYQEAAAKAPIFPSSFQLEQLIEPGVIKVPILNQIDPTLTQPTVVKPAVYIPYNSGNPVDSADINSI